MTLKLDTVSAPSSGLLYLDLGGVPSGEGWSSTTDGTWTCNLSTSSQMPCTHTHTHTHSSSQSSLSSTPHAPRLKKPVLLSGPHHGEGGALPSTHELIKRHSYLDEGEVW